MDKTKKIVVIGGGTGTYSILSGLKNYDVDITAIVSMADSGGSARKERDEWGLLPSSDIRKSLLALADVSTADLLLLRKLFQYRFEVGRGIVGMTFGNLFLVTLTKILGSQSEAIKKASEFLRIKGKVLPVTLDKVDLVAIYDNGKRIVGEHFIDHPQKSKNSSIKSVSTYPEARINPEVKNAIAEAGLIIIGPGSFYTTVIANLVISGMREAVSESKATKIFILNLMTEIGQTHKYTATRFMDILDQYLPISAINYVLINSAPIPDNILSRYKMVDTEPITNDFGNENNFKVIPQDLISKRSVNKEKGDTLRRSFVRHDGKKVAKICMQILNLL